MRIHSALRFLLVFGPVCTALAGTAATAGAQAKLATPSESTSLIYSVKGPDLFRTYCAACHGSDAKGGGPVAPALKAKVPDLTVLAKSSGGKFPTERVRKVITGEEVVASHGSREMPIWGPIFHQIESDQDLGNVRIENLTKYLASIQSAK